MSDTTVTTVSPSWLLLLVVPGPGQSTEDENPLVWSGPGLRSNEDERRGGEVTKYDYEYDQVRLTQ